MAFRVALALSKHAILAIASKSPFLLPLGSAGSSGDGASRIQIALVATWGRDSKFLMSAQQLIAGGNHVDPSGSLSSSDGSHVAVREE